MINILYSLVCLLSFLWIGFIVLLMLLGHKRMVNLYDKKYIELDAKPIKCWFCGSSDIKYMFKIRNTIGNAICKRCGKKLGVYKEKNIGNSGLYKYFWRYKLCVLHGMNTL